MNHSTRECVTRAIERVQQQLQAIEASQDDWQRKEIKADVSLETLLEYVVEMLPPEQQESVKACLEIHHRIVYTSHGS